MLTRRVRGSGAPIQDMNTVRKHLSAIQGGRLAAACRAPVLALVVIWAAVVFATGYVSLGSIVAAALLPLLVWVLHPDSRNLVALDALVAAGIIWLHRANIRRLLAGTENRFGKRRATAPPST
jgi:glycerol-3-phosphate acyltransferase PlsY